MAKPNCGYGEVKFIRSPALPSVVSSFSRICVAGPVTVDPGVEPVCEVL
jgi:hypothetical protein